MAPGRAAVGMPRPAVVVCTSVNSAIRSRRSDASRTRRARRSAVVLARSCACRAAYRSRRASALSSRAASRARSAASKRSLAASNAPSADFIAARASESASWASASLRRNSASSRIASRRSRAPLTTQPRMPGRLNTGAVRAENRSQRWLSRASPWYPCRLLDVTSGWPSGHAVLTWLTIFDL